MIFYALDRSSPFVVPSVVPMNIGKGATVANKLDILFRKSSRSPKTPSPPLRLSVSCCDAALHWVTTWVVAQCPGAF